MILHRSIGEHPRSMLKRFLDLNIFRNFNNCEIELEKFTDKKLLEMQLREFGTRHQGNWWITKWAILFAFGGR